MPHPRPWHRASTFGPGHRTPLNRDQRARFRYLLEAAYRARRITAVHHRVGEALLRRLSTEGQCDPSQVTLANDAGCNERTVRRAIVRMRALGLLRWQQRITRNGWRCEQTSNSYELLITAPVCGGLIVRGIKRNYNRGSGSADRSSAIEAINAARLAIERRIAERFKLRFVP